MVLHKAHHHLAPTYLLMRTPANTSTSSLASHTQLDEFLGSYSVHLGRLKLMKDDPAAEKMLGLLNRQLLAAQVDVDTFYSRCGGM